MRDEDRLISESIKTTPHQISSDPPVDHTMLDHVILWRSLNVQSAHIDGETVLLDLSTGRYYTLNRLGSAIWEYYINQNTIRDIHTAICDRFEVASEQALEDIVDFVNHMAQEGLLVSKNEK